MAFPSCQSHNDLTKPRVRAFCLKCLIGEEKPDDVGCAGGLNRPMEQILTTLYCY
jgi:hypothetical protein